MRQVNINQRQQMQRYSSRNGRRKLGISGLFGASGFGDMNKDIPAQNVNLLEGVSRKHRPDYGLVILSLLLLAIGVVVIYAIGPALASTHGSTKPNFYVDRQLIAIGLSLVAFIITANLPLSMWLKFKKPLLIAAGILTLIAIITPVSLEYPAHRWARLGSLSFQSVELVKFVLMIFLASFLARKIKTGQEMSFKSVIMPVFLVLALLGIVIAVMQSDLGSMVVIVAMSIIMLFVAGVPLRKVILISSVVIIGVVLAIVATPYRRDRLATFFSPESDCQASGYQACHAHIAVGSGGIIGQGLGSGAQAYGYLPEAENDSIFAIYAEKFGFIGVSFILAIFVGLFARLTRIAERTDNPFLRLIVVGLLAWLSLQTIMNIGAMLGLLPLKGITLPLVSYGGTSVIFIMSAIGVVFQISRYTQFRTVIDNNPSERKNYENTYGGRRLRRPHNTSGSSRSRN